MSANAVAVLAVLGDVMTLAVNATRAAAEIGQTLRAAQAAGVDVTDEQLAAARALRQAALADLDDEVRRRTEAEADPT